ncbi:unnamed protein product [Durusdinium trenchii]|uniref:Non-specific serine/threonine protein kinase n=1 Tax=Durusdinium trenchii TaxID=1381693 RepID=A0ABP0S1T7_9DINO
MAWLPALSLAAFVIYMADHLGGWLSVRLSSFREDSVPSMKGKVVVVTGGNAGIGWHTVRLLAAAGAKVILACRAVQKGFEQVQTLPPEVAQQVEVMELDLAVFESIVAFSRRFQEKYQQLHVLVLNAGLAKTFLGSAGWKLTPEGLEEMVGVSFLGHYLLCRLLLPVLRHGHSRVIGQSSVAMANSYLRGIDPKSWTSKPQDYHDWKQYGQAKLAMRLFMTELQRREPGVLCLANHPGVVENTSLMHPQGAGIVERWYDALLFKLWGMRAADGGLQTAWLASTAAEQLQGGACYKPIGRERRFISDPLQRLGNLQAPLPMRTDFPTLWTDAENVVNERAGEIKQCYTLSSEKLGEGGFGYVTKGRSLETGSHYAVKKVSKAKAKQRRVQVRSEIDVMKLTDHPNVVTLHETFEDKSHLYLVMELCGGGDLDKHMQRQKGPYSEHQAAILMEQILKSVSYLHDCKGICHRDLKPHNFLFLRQAPVEANVLKLADFGLACSFQPGEVLSSKVGTVLYCSPQVLGGVYDSSADLWSCGVIMYMLLGHELPFSGKNDAEVAKSVRKGNYAFSDPVWLSVSEDGKDLIRKMLKFQPFDRATASQARQHVWFSFAAPELRSACALRASVLSDLLRFSARSAFQRAALRAVAMQLSQEEVEPLWRDFSALDVKGCGLVGAAELQELLQSGTLDAVEEDLWKVVAILRGRPVGDDVIGFTDFLAASLPRVFSHWKEGHCRKAFRIFDRNGDGYIDAKELELVLRREGEETHIEAFSSMLHEAADSKQVSYKDFVKFVKQGASLEL